jgi:tetratricopeptide (TPR) repeat protein
MRRVFGEEHPVVATSLNNLAQALSDQGKYDEAERLYLQSLNIIRPGVGKEHMGVAASMHNISVLFNTAEIR